MTQSQSFSPRNELSWRKSRLSSSMSHERSQITTAKRPASSGVYGSKQLIRPAQIQHLDYHSAKLEDKYRELKELLVTSVTGDISSREEEILRYTHRVMRSMKLAHADTSFSSDATSQSAPVSRPGEFSM